MQPSAQRLLLYCLAAALVTLPWHAAPVQAQREAVDPENVLSLIEALTPLQRVGQLFIVPLEGDAPSPETRRLLADLSVGGVVLDPARGNFTNAPDAPAQVAGLANELQAEAIDAGAGIPLIVAIEHGGDGYPRTPLQGGMTLLPSSMALGATWNPTAAERIGEIVGRELAAAGVNLLLGPSLDVVAVPQPGGPGDLGVRSFGGSGDWVGRMGERYIVGVHAGSRGRVATAAGNFPGIGGADRSAAEEVAVVEKTFQELAAVELVPFARIGAPGMPGTTDAIVTSHVRYRGIQQQADRPLSLDSGGLRYLLAQVQALADWRAAGGVLVSPGLGQLAVRRYDDPELVTFNHRRVIRESLAAGHDLIVLTGLGEAGSPASEAAAIEDGIRWLADVYSEDEAVRDAVDESLARVLALKRRLYPSFRTVDVQVDAGQAGAVTGIGTEEVLAVAREALTQVAPAGGAGSADSNPAAPTSPQMGDRLLFVVDARSIVPCRECAPELALDPEGLVASVRRTYGAEGAHRIEDADVAAVTSTELKAWLQSTGAVVTEDTVALVPELDPTRLAEVDRLVGAANWLVFAIRDIRPAESPGSDALKLYLKNTPPGGAQRVVALAFAAPYYLDTTEIAKLTAYFVLYSRTPPFQEVAVRALFGDHAAQGASPVSVPGIGYDLHRSLEPADSAVLLELVGLDPGRPVDLGATFTVRTTAIHDANGHIVPDGTPVTFRRYARAEGLFLPDVQETTSDGRATGEMRAERPEDLEVSAVFANGLRSVPLVVAVRDTGIRPTAPPAAGPLMGGATFRGAPVDWRVLLFSLGLMVLAAVMGYAADPRVGADPSRMTRMALLSLSWGLGGYLLVAAGGLDLSTIGVGELWPDTLNIAYQAPLFSFVLAILPAVPSVVRLGRARLTARHHRLPRREDGEQQ